MECGPSILEILWEVEYWVRSGCSQVSIRTQLKGESTRARFYNALVMLSKGYSVDDDYNELMEVCDGEIFNLPNCPNPRDHKPLG